MAIVKLTVSQNLRWLFREQHESDQGIDGQIETAFGGVGSGRLIAVQIKSGPSYFRESTDEGWIFRFGENKARLWLGHALPVMVLLIDTNSHTVFWQRIALTTVESTGKGYKVLVPRANNLKYASDEWEHIASGLEFRAHERYEFVLAQVPPSTREALVGLHGIEPEHAEVLALHLAEGRDNAVGTCQALISAKPHWITKHSSFAWLVVASYAAEHDANIESAIAFELAADADARRRGKMLASGGLNMISVDRDRACKLLRRAEFEGGAKALVAIGNTLLAHPLDDARPFELDGYLLGDSQEVHSSAVVQQFLSEQSVRIGDIEAACTYAERALELDPEDASSMDRVARALSVRASNAGAQSDDLERAKALLGLAIDQRHSWGGPTKELLPSLLRILMIRGEFAQVLRRCLPPPEGDALPNEARIPEVLRTALRAANMAGRRDLVAQIDRMMGDTSADLAARFDAGVVQLSDYQHCAMLTEILDESHRNLDYEKIAATTIRLACLGSDESSRMVEYVEKGIIPEYLADLAATVAKANTNLDAELPSLRALARHNAIAAEHLIELLRRAGRLGESADVCVDAYETHQIPMFLIQHAGLLIEAEDWVAAEAAAQRVLSSTTGYVFERRRLLIFLAAQSGDRGEWSTAEQHIAEAITSTGQSDDRDVWKLVAIQLERGSGDRAAATVRRYRPVVRCDSEARMWLSAMSVLAWDAHIVSEALSLSARFEKDPALAVAILGQIITATQCDDEPDSEDHSPIEQGGGYGLPRVPGDLHRQAFAALDRLVDRHGEVSGVRVLKGDSDQLVERMQELVRQQSGELPAEFLNMLQHNRLPIGILATLRRGSYALALVKRATGPLVAASTDEDEHDIEVAVAKSALGCKVSVDATSLVVVSRLQDCDVLMGQFSTVLLAAISRRDITRAVGEVSMLAASPGVVGWDPRADSMVFYEQTVEEFREYKDRVGGLDRAARAATIRSVNLLPLFARLSFASDAPWLAPIQLAADENIPLWCDDLGTRRLARAVGVEAFGTPALIDAIAKTAVESSITDAEIDTAAAELANRMRTLASERIVDVPVSLNDLLELAAADDWKPKAAALVISRGSWWLWQDDPIADMIVLYKEIGKRDAEALVDWQVAAMLGAARSRTVADDASTVLAIVALVGFDLSPSVEKQVAGLCRARELAGELDCPDPLTMVPVAARFVARMGQSEYSEQYVADLMANFADEDYDSSAHSD
ncbi:DUF4365 domain-containing protein [Rhodococcus sp. OK302]|uniref:DUF4365 domain-containing protein n=1 Tax=Rhodococcus sp. OK302 TaxID=1882769 RepID=UPI0015958245|nr:DUF4365 domain-containing protein [Rhodococcus sp. OK302]